MALLKLSSPWIIFYREMQKMFEYDQFTHIVFDEDENLIRVYVEDDICKANALKKILPEEKTFGNVTIKIKVFGPSNEEPKYLKRYSPDNIIAKDIFKPMEGVYYCTDTYSNDNRENPFKSTASTCWP